MIFFLPVFKIILLEEIYCYTIEYRLSDIFQNYLHFREYKLDYKMVAKRFILSTEFIALLINVLLFLTQKTLTWITNM